MDFGKWIKQQRKYYGMSQTELANDVGVCQNTISDWERGYQSPTLNVAERVIRSFGGELIIRERI